MMMMQACASLAVPCAVFFCVDAEGSLLFLMPQVCQLLLQLEPSLHAGAGVLHLMLPVRASSTLSW